jgi:hypothetical protein
MVDNWRWYPKPTREEPEALEEWFRVDWMPVYMLVRRANNDYQVCLLANHTDEAVELAARKPDCSSHMTMELYEELVQHYNNQDEMDESHVDLVFDKSTDVIIKFIWPPSWVRRADLRFHKRLDTLLKIADELDKLAEKARVFHALQRLHGTHIPLQVQVSEPLTALNAQNEKLSSYQKSPDSGVTKRKRKRIESEIDADSSYEEQFMLKWTNFLSKKLAICKDYTHYFILRIIFYLDYFVIILISFLNG